MSHPRRKRAAPEQLYKHCLAGGDCIPDVQNKYEQNTLADLLLKIFGGLVYFGGLGIGSGKGSGGSLGYKPLGSSTTGRPAPTAPVRPNIIVDALGPAEIIPIAPESSSIVPLAEGLPDVNILAPDTGPTLGTDEIELFTIRNPTTDVGGVSETPTIISSEEGSVAVLEVQPIPERPVEVTYDPTDTALHAINIVPADPLVTTDINVYVDPSYSGRVIGDFEEIPLDRLNYSSFEVEEPPTTSTPSDKLDKLVYKTKSFYSKYLRQEPVSNIEFLNRPSRLVQFEFENPAYEDADVTLTFERDLEQVSAAPESAFADIVKLSRPYFSRTTEGGVRVSRLGETATIVTRSGTTIGPKIHFYQDLSTIDNVENIELDVINTPEYISTVVDDLLAASPVDPFDFTTVDYNDTSLVDEYAENFNNAQLFVQTTDETDEVSFIPILPAEATIRVFSPDSTYLFTNLPNNINMNSSLINLTSAQIIQDSSDFFLHPSLIPKKRRRLSDSF